MMSAPRKDSGFTLVEMLVALAIFAIMSGGTMMALTGAMDTRDAVSVRMEDLGTLETTRAVIRTDMLELVPRQARDSFGTPIRDMINPEAGTLMVFTRTGRPNPGGLEKRSELQRVSYHFEAGRLIRKMQVRVNPPSDNPVIEQVLLDGLNTADIDFMREGKVVRTISQTGEDFRMVQSPDNPGETPSMMRLALVFDNDTALTLYFEIAP